MTIANAVNRNTYVGAGGVGPFPYNFMIFAATDLRVIKRNAAGVETVLAYPAAYSVTGIGLAVGGSITTTTAVAAGEVIVIRRVRPLTQGTDLRGQASFLPETYEDALDHLTMIVQQHQTDLDRRFGVDESVETAAYDLLIPIGSLGQVVGWGAAGLTNMNVSAGAVALPGAGRTVASLSAYLANNAVFQVLDYAPIGVVINSGVNDATAFIVAADTAAGAGGGLVDFAPGTYKTTANLVCGKYWRGIPWRTIIQPTNAVTKCIDLISDIAGTNGILEGFFLDGVNTIGKTGLHVGTALTNLTVVRNCSIWNFKFVGGRGIKCEQLVTGSFENVYVCRNYINLHCNGGNTPTDTVFMNCQFREATTKGVWIETGYGIKFIKPLFEANGEEGIYFQNVGGTAIEIEIDGGWSESNWYSLLADPVTRATKYSLYVDGANGPSGTIRIKVRNHKYEGETAKAMRLTNAIAFLVDACHVVPAGGVKIDVDGTSYGKFPNWPEQNGAFNTKVAMPAVNPGVAPAGFNAQQRIEDLEGAWIPWVPVVTGGGTMTIAALVINEARYKILGNGKTVLIYLDIGFTTGVAGAALVIATLPANIRSRNANRYVGAWTIDGAYTDGYARADGASPTSSMYFARKDGANWGVGAGKNASCQYILEMF